VSTTVRPARPARAQHRRSNGSGERRDAELLRRYARTRDPHLRDQLVERYLPLAHYVARHYARGHEPFDDLMQIACLGLLKAIDRFDPGRNTAFSSYALPTMSGEIRRHFRDRGWAVRPPRDLQETAIAVEAAGEALHRRLGRSPTVTEIGDATDLDEEAVLEAREALSAKFATSLSTPSGDAEQDVTLEGRLGIADAGYEAAEQRATLEPLLARLPRRDRTIMRLRFEHDLTQTEIGELVGLSQMHVSRVIRSCLEQMRQAAQVQ
jgi:RNA polymerase sigma-B factor